jgi:succinoglycan biosynthesis protein ExoM
MTSMLTAEPARAVPHISVCICTYKRAGLLQRLLERLQFQETAGTFTYSAVVADNDQSRSAESLVASLSHRLPFQIVYCSEPIKNIALVRNKALENACGDFIAFIDDDEFPAENWLRTLLQTCESHSASGVLGPVRPHFDETPPNWLVKGRFCERPEHPTGTVMDWSKCRTGNVLFRRSILNDVNEPFRKEFGTGGEDQDFFRRMGENGFKFVWCNQAVAYETVPPSRWTRSYLMKRALLRGSNGLKHPKGRAKLLAKAVIAVPAYALMTPLTILLGQHVFIMFSIRLCDHLGRLLCLLRLNPVNARDV